MDLVSRIGSKVEYERTSYYHEKIVKRPQVDDNGRPISRVVRLARSKQRYSNCVFLTGANGLQTQATAAGNAGNGLIFVPEIKSGKAKYTDLDGTYGPLLDFYERTIAAKSYRKLNLFHLFMFVVYIC